MKMARTRGPVLCLDWQTTTCPTDHESRMLAGRARTSTPIGNSAAHAAALLLRKLQNALLGHLLTTPQVVFRSSRSSGGICRRSRTRLRPCTACASSRPTLSSPSPDSGTSFAASRRSRRPPARLSASTPYVILRRCCEVEQLLTSL